MNYKKLEYEDKFWQSLTKMHDHFNKLLPLIITGLFYKKMFENSLNSQLSQIENSARTTLRDIK